ncbi:PqqD family protein [Sphingomonas sp.]|uniref:PqqD family protein n=1 Tax=Sphingomonas sp. TaxID=28214 RepID=UPI001B167EC3|nr:PqqD family protein [Sphingomonas sp.]MBO9711653.1 PqqD family protein [Sphingomonas sp.]
MIVRRQGDWITAKVGDELVMMSTEKGKYIGLSDVGACVWALIEAPRSVDEVCAQLEREFDVAPDVCRADVETFLEELVRHGVATLDSIAPS